MIYNVWIGHIRLLKIIKVHRIQIVFWSKLLWQTLSEQYYYIDIEYHFVLFGRGIDGGGGGGVLVITHELRIMIQRNSNHTFIWKIAAYLLTKLFTVNENTFSNNFFSNARLAHAVTNHVLPSSPWLRSSQVTPSTTSFGTLQSS